MIPSPVIKVVKLPGRGFMKAEFFVKALLLDR